MSSEKRNVLREVMRIAWQFVKRNGYGMGEALRVAWLNIKLRSALHKGVVKFYFQKIDGSVRQAFGTLKEGIIPMVSGNGSRKPNDTIQTYFDTEKNEWRCYKIANLLSIG